MGLGAASAPGQTEIDDGGGDGMPEWDDDDLAAMQAEPMVRPLQCKHWTASCRLAGCCGYNTSSV